MRTRPTSRSGHLIDIVLAGIILIACARSIFAFFVFPSWCWAMAQTVSGSILSDQCRLLFVWFLHLAIAFLYLLWR